MIEREMDAGVFVSRSEAEATSFASTLELYAKGVTSKKRSSASELSRIQAMQRHSLALRSLASIRGSDMASYRDKRLGDTRMLIRYYHPKVEHLAMKLP